jgi:hypothetical protein
MTDDAKQTDGMKATSAFAWFTPQWLGSEIAASVLILLRMIPALAIAAFAVWLLPKGFADRTLWQTIVTLGELPMGSAVGVFVVISYMRHSGK